MLKQTNNFDAFLFDKRVYNVIEMKKMQKISSAQQINKNQQINDDDC